MELLKIDVNENQEPVVSGRQLHEVLEVKTKYADWFNRMLDYGFTENQDFLLLKNEQQTGRGGHNKIDHIIKLDMAKEIAMIQRTDKGKKVRKYFIQVEKDFNSPEKIMQRALLYAQQNITKLEAQIETDKPKVLFANAVSASKTSILIGDFAKLLRQNGKSIGQNRLFQWLRDGGYLISRKGSSWNMPTQRSMDMGLFEIKETTISHADGHISVNKTPKMTGKGQVYFMEKLLKDIVA